MSLVPFPEHLDAVRLFTSHGAINAILPVSRLNRLVENLADNSGQVEVKLRFGRDEERRKLLSGSLRTEVNVICQRCLQPMPLVLESNIALLVLESEDEIKALPTEEAVLDTILMGPEGLDVLEVVEDELILSLPLVPVHAEEDCNEAFNALRVASNTVKEGKTSPFAVLASIKRDS